MSGMNMQVGNSLNNMVSQFFRKVKGVVYDLQSGGIALKNADGSISVLDKELTDGGEGRAFKLSTVPFNVTMAVPAFAMHTELAKVKPGDLVMSTKGILGFLISTGKQEGLVNSVYKVLRPNGAISTVAIPVNTVFGKEGVMVVQSLNFGEGDGAMNPMMLMALAGGGDIDPLMLMAMTGGMGGGDGAMNPMMLMAMSGQGNIDPMMLMAMSGGMGDMNPMMLMAMSGKLGGNSDGVWRT